MPHLQGLMHWFSCVPDMDFQYVIDVILNGNPCKYWAPSGETCPALSAQCAGTYCGSSGASPAAAPATPAAPAPTTTAAPAEETTTTEPGVKVDPGTCGTTGTYPPECECVPRMSTRECYCDWDDPLCVKCGGPFGYAIKRRIPPAYGGYNKRCIAAYRLDIDTSVASGPIQECGALCDAEATCTSFDYEEVAESFGWCQLCKAGAESANLEDSPRDEYGSIRGINHYVYAPNLCAMR